MKGDVDWSLVWIVACALLALCVFAGCATAPAAAASAISQPDVKPAVKVAAGDQSKVTTTTATTTTSTADAVSGGAKTQGDVGAITQILGLTAEERKAQQDEIRAWQQALYHTFALMICFAAFAAAQITDKHWLEFFLYVVCIITGAYACGLVPALPAFPFWRGGVS